MSARLAERFEHLVARIFQAEEFEVLLPRHSNYKITSHMPVEMTDMILQKSQGRPIIVEVKLYRSREVPIGTISRALEMVEKYRRFNENYVGMIVISSSVSQISKQFAERNYPNIIICDYSIIRALAAKHQHLLDEFDDIIRVSLIDAEIPPETDVDINFLDRPQVVVEATAAPEPPEQLGSAICAEIKGLKPGKRDARKFEEKVAEALKYIFSDDLVSWHREKTAGDGLSRYDLIARVASKHDFWRLIVRSFSSHYIIFEFKNYDEKIKQPQIYTTEKYLYTKALRSTAIIISRKGPDKNAYVASIGALRESGKLIINLTTDQVCEMLIRRDNGSDHNEILVDVLDQILMGVSR